MDDILELTYQRVHLAADKICAMDWTYLGRGLNEWISRTMSKETFFYIPEDESWDCVSFFYTDLSGRGLQTDFTREGLEPVLER